MAERIQERTPRAAAIPSAAIASLEKSLLDAGAPILERWRHMLDAPGVPPVVHPYQRYVLATMLETTQRVLQHEAVQTTNVFGSNYVPAMLGMTRQIFPRMVGTDLVSVQPMDRPSGQVFHLELLRDDGSSFGVRPNQDASSLNSATYLASRTYADFTGNEGDPITKGMRLSITSTSVQITKVKKLKTEASWELNNDLAAVHNLNAMDLLQGAAVDEIAYEIDGMIVKAVRDAALANGTVIFGSAPTGYPPDKWPARLQRAILEAHRIIRRKSLRDPNIIIAGMGAYVELQDLNTFQLAAPAAFDSGIYGVLPVGTLNGQYTVYLSQFVPDNELLIGRRGQGFLDAGIVYCPYVALFVSERFFDPNTQRTVQSFASRFEIVTLSTNLYARVVIDPSTQGITTP